MIFRKSPKNKSEQGQATIEFALSLILIMGFIFFYIQLALVFAWSNYIHYATFMSARAYLSGSVNREDQEERARKVIVKMLKKGESRAGLDRFPSVARGVGGDGLAGFYVRPPKEFNPSIRNFSWLEGVRYAFRSKLFLIPFGGSSKESNDGGKNEKSVNEISLTSESWLGREPSYAECINYLSKKAKEAVTEVVIDNGC